MVNVHTDKGTLLQSGMLFKEGQGEAITAWADQSQGNLNPRQFRRVPYRPNELYQFQILYENSGWQVCAGNDRNIATEYQCEVSVTAKGTHLKEHKETSVWFENANNNPDWHTDFPKKVAVSHARIIRNGIYHNWTKEVIGTRHPCGKGTHLPEKAMSGSLKNNGTAAWIVAGVPRVCHLE